MSSGFFRFLGESHVHDHDPTIPPSDDERRRRGPPAWDLAVHLDEMGEPRPNPNGRIRRLHAPVLLRGR